MVNPQAVLRGIKYKTGKYITVIRFHEVVRQGKEELHVTVNKNKRVAEKALQEAYVHRSGYSKVFVCLA